VKNTKIDRETGPLRDRDTEHHNNGKFNFAFNVIILRNRNTGNIDQMITIASFFNETYII
jgi:hypothetical protein